MRVLASLIIVAFFGAFAYAQQGTSFPPVMVQATNVVTDGSGNWSVAWNTQFQSASPFISAKAIVPTTNNPVACEIVSRTASTVSGWCRQNAPALLNLSIITSGLTLNPFGAIPAAGTTVMVIGRDVTQ